MTSFFPGSITHVHFGCTSEDGGGANLSITGDSFTMSGGAMDGTVGPCGAYGFGGKVKSGFTLDFREQTDSSISTLEWMGGVFPFSEFPFPPGDATIDVRGPAVKIPDTGAAFYDLTVPVSWHGGLGACIGWIDTARGTNWDCSIPFDDIAAAYPIDNFDPGSQYTINWLAASGFGTGSASIFLKRIDVGVYKITDMSYSLDAGLPEPSSLLLLATGAVAALLAKRAKS